MMTVVNKALYQRYRSGSDKYLLHDLWLPMLLFGSMGAITWAIRGTNGWGGIDGVLVPGLTWGLLWYYLCWRRGIDARGMVLWLGLGLAIGGELGYGQYVSWIRGQFRVGEEILPISPWIGYAWFMICGIGSGATGSIILGWALSHKTSMGEWLLRIFLMLMLLIIIFNIPLAGLEEGAVSGIGDKLVQYCPGLLFPNAGLGLYAGELDKHLERTVYTNTQNFAVLVWWGIALLAAVFQRDKNTLFCGSIIGLGFGFWFALSAVWCLGYVYAPQLIDWWKMWELHAGFNFGLTYALVMFWVIRQVDKEHTTIGKPSGTQATDQTPIVSNTYETVLMSLGGFLLVFAAAVEYFPWTGVLLALFYPMSLMMTMRADPCRGAELRKRVSLTYSAFLLVFMLVHGATSRLGVVVGLYAPDAVDQYDWPTGRIALFVPVAALLFVIATARMVQHYRSDTKPVRLNERMIDLCAFIGLVGAISIWPAKISVLYALFLCTGLFALTRIKRHLEEFDR